MTGLPVPTLDGLGHRLVLYNFVRQFALGALQFGTRIRYTVFSNKPYSRFVPRTATTLRFAVPQDSAGCGRRGTRRGGGRGKSQRVGRDEGGVRTNQQLSLPHCQSMTQQTSEFHAVHHSQTSHVHSFDLNPQPSTLDPQPSTLNPQPSTLNPQPSTLNPQPSTLNPTFR